MTADQILEQIHNKLIVSVQAYPGEPMRHPDTMARIAEACEQGGAAAIRCQGLEDIRAIKERVSIPVIGLVKEGHEGVFITPTLDLALKAAEAGPDMVAIDATDRPRPDGKTFEEVVRYLTDRGIPVMGDCRNLDDIKRSFAAGCLVAGTTLSHGMAATEHKASDGPDLKLIQDAIKACPQKPIICEGSVHSPQDAKQAILAGAYSVVVGTAITHPQSITSWYCEELKGAL